MVARRANFKPPEKLCLSKCHAFAMVLAAWCFLRRRRGGATDQLL
jgi:hypothetical protein